MSAPIPIPLFSRRRMRDVYEATSSRSPAMITQRLEQDRNEVGTSASHTIENGSLQTHDAEGRRNPPVSNMITYTKGYGPKRAEELMDMISSSPLSDIDSYFEDKHLGVKRHKTEKVETKSMISDNDDTPSADQGSVTLPSRESIRWRDLLVFKDRIVHDESSDDEKINLPKLAKHPLFDYFYIPEDPLDEDSKPREYDPTVPKKFKDMYIEEKRIKRQKHCAHERLRKNRQSDRISLESELESEDDGEDDWNIKPLYGKSNLFKLLARAPYEFFLSPEQRKQIEILGETAGAVVLDALHKFSEEKRDVYPYHVISAIMYAYNRFIMVKYLLPEVKNHDRVTAEELEKRSRKRINGFYESLRVREERKRLGIPSHRTAAVTLNQTGDLSEDDDADDADEEDDEEDDDDYNHNSTAASSVHEADTTFVEDASTKRKKRRFVDIPPPLQMALTTSSAPTQSFHVFAKKLAFKMNTESAQKFRDEVKYNDTLLETWQKYHPDWEIIKTKMTEENFTEKNGFIPLWKMADDMLFPHLFKRAGITADE